MLSWTCSSKRTCTSRNCTFSKNGPPSVAFRSAWSVAPISACTMLRFCELSRSTSTLPVATAAESWT
jgi:hypothetical protein